jgi:anti-sigma B factor antagonist
MDMQIETLAPGVVKLVLTGRLDVAGAGKIDLQFNTIAGSHRGVIVDMAGVEFLSSIGIRVLVLGAKTMHRRGGKLVLLAPQPEVMKVLEVVGILDLLPVAASAEEAKATMA